MTTIYSQAGRVDRRKFLVGTGAMVVAIGAPRLVNPEAAFAALEEDFPVGQPVDADQIDSWVAIGSDGRVTIFTGKEEQGTGVATATIQVAADELDVSLDSIDLIISDTWKTVNQSYSSGSQSLITEYGPNGVRQACAEARAALLGMAAAKLNAPVGQLTVSKGVVSVAGSPSRSVPYTSLIGGKKFNLAQTGKAKPKPFSDYTVAGTSVPRVEIPDIVFGNFTYVPDVRLPGMLHARMVKPPTLESTLVSVDGFKGPAPKDLVKVVTRKNLVAVVAKSQWGAVNAASQLQVTWKIAPLPKFETFFDDLRAMSPTTDQVLVNTNDVDEKLASGTKMIEASYRYPHQMHGPVGASVATAWVKDNTATVWSSTQGVYHMRGALATVLDMPEENVHVIFVEGSGHYGLCAADNVSLDAAVIAQAVGKPVRVQYTQADEHNSENFGPAYSWSLRGAIDTAGAKPKIVAWDRTAWTSSRGNRPGPPGNLPSGIQMGYPELPLAPSPPPTPSLAPNTVNNRNEVPAYIIPSQRVVTHTGEHMFLTAPLRAPWRIQNTFANESFMDELAFAAGADPLDFRVDHLEDERLLAVTQAAAKLAKWQARPPAAKIGKGRYLSGRGISSSHYEGNNGYNALVVAVTVDTKTGKITVDHAWSAQDCGPAVNPDGMRAQAEGCLLQGISRTLIEELKWGPNGITTRDWASYPVIRFTAMPTFDFQIINRIDKPVLGAGEVLITNVPAAIANAVFDATGVRIRQVPFTPTRVRAALAV
jgi:CO/xanthine dehydrogenase Mo-binding subunit